MCGMKTERSLKPISDRPGVCDRNLPSGYVKIAIENDHLMWIFPLKMVIFHSYVSLPEGILNFQNDGSAVHETFTDTPQ